jgi:hypothetical protein
VCYGRERAMLRIKIPSFTDVTCNEINEFTQSVCLKVVQFLRMSSRTALSLGGKCSPLLIYM